MRLLDAGGTTIALVNPASPGALASTMKYDPSGTPSGNTNGWPFLYQGMEHEIIEPNQYY